MKSFVTVALFAVATASALGAPLSVRQDQDDGLRSPKLRIEWAAFKRLYDSNQVVVVDVRESVSYAAGHIPGARSIPLDQIERRAAALKELRKPVVLYCA